MKIKEMVFVVGITINGILSLVIEYHYGQSSSPDHTELLKEVAHTVTRPAYEDQEMTVEMPLSEIYTEYEMDL